MESFWHGFAALAMIGAVASGCSGNSDASRSLTFDATSDTAIVILGTNVTREQQEEIRAGRSFSTFWVEYDPVTKRLVPDGATFETSIVASAFSDEPAYLKPTVSVLQVRPGDYALIGAGFPHLMSTFVRSKDGLKDDKGRGQSWHFTVDPRLHIDPSAEVSRNNHLFSVAAGEVLYVGHFEFVKWDYIDSLRGINYFQDEAAARQALSAYPKISGVMRTFDPAKPPQEVRRW
ncbi:hypothetical protein AAFN88_03160 [Pelagibius sp. CAU 1746]|uniref:hypothetical protein n=1 Tax=Pelagibius sp. CAU 1746 TaxID=3140370 RepID=UPI00325BF085